MRRNLILFLISILLFLAVDLLNNKRIIKNIFTSKEIIKIKLVNSKYISEDYFHSRIKVKEGQNFWLFNPMEFKRDLNNIKEIKNYDFKLDWNGILTIRIQEKEPYMIWIRDNKKNFIDQQGNFLELNINEKKLRIIHLYGENANKKVSELSKVLEKYSFILNNINEINYDKKIGWNIKMIDNNCISLPLKRLDKLIKMFENIKNSNLYEKFSFFDFRVIGRVYMSNRKC